MSSLKVTGADPSLVTYRDSEILTTKHKIVDITKSERDLDHVNTYDLEEGMRLTADWMRRVYDFDNLQEDQPLPDTRGVLR